MATNSVRGGASRRILDRIAREGVIFDAWDDEPWVLEGAAVGVSLICFSQQACDEPIRLDGHIVQRINPDLTVATDLTAARPLPENAEIAFSGIEKGKIRDTRKDCKKIAEMPLNPNGRPNSDALFPWWNGDDVTAANRDYWIINFGEKSLPKSALYEKPFSHVERMVYPIRKIQDLIWNVSIGGNLPVERQRCLQ